MQQTQRYKPMCTRTIRECLRQRIRSLTHWPLLLRVCVSRCPGRLRGLARARLLSHFVCMRVFVYCRIRVHACMYAHMHGHEQARVRCLPLCYLAFR